ncbi:MAG: efflux RND transporter periplasmic adaptor subunit [Mailhella sp.]|nr:efflux RND transporter periplasmic adaptor subunit [Mailhella sp.]
MLKMRSLAPVLMALPLLFAGCGDTSGDSSGWFGETVASVQKYVTDFLDAHLNRKPSAQHAPAGVRAVRVTTLEMKPHKVSIERELTGRTTAYRWAEVRPEVNGIMRERCFTEGTHVKAGDVLYRIEPDIYRAALDSARAALAGAEANLQVTRLRERRTADMLRSKSVSQQDYDDVKAALKQAQASFQAAQASVRSAEISLNRTEIKAPISGIITKSSFSVGALLSASQARPLATIYQTDPIYVEVSQSSDDLYDLKRQFEARGAGVRRVMPSNIQATLTMHDGSVYPSVGHLNFTGVDVDETTNTVLLRAEFPNPEMELLPGLFVRTRVIMGEDENAVLAPQKAVLREANGTPYVYLIGADGRAVRRVITIDKAVGTDWYVTDGLKTGEKIILDGVNNVRAGQPVQEVVPEAMQKDTKAGGGK